MNLMKIRETTHNDFEKIWPIFSEIAAAGETYALSRNITKAEAKVIWLDSPRKTFVLEENGEILGSYYIKTNQAGPGSHVCNCGYMVSSAARGRGVATLLCEHSQEIAKQMGYKAMQFNFVIKTNEKAVVLWKSLGFEVIGEIPEAYRHPLLGLVPALIMHQKL